MKRRSPFILGLDPRWLRLSLTNGHPGYLAPALPRLRRLPLVDPMAFVTIPPGPSPAMAVSPMSQQLLQHLHALSEVNEALTLRLLDLEERLRDLERRVDDAQQDVSADAAGLLAEADQRLLRLQDLLTAGPTQRPPRPLARTSAPLASLRLGRDGTHADDDEEGLEDQPFMDEMEACQDVA